jgi:hypothetical protein
MSVNFEDKVLGYLAQLTQELTVIKHTQQQHSQQLTTLQQSVSRIEHDYGEKLSALFDAREVQADVNEKILSTLGRIEAKMDVLQMETAHIRRIK